MRVSGGTAYVRYAATDAAGNVEAVKSQQSSFTVDDVAPSVTVTSPADGAAGVLVGSNIVVTFSEPVTVDTSPTWIEVVCPS